MFASKYSSKDRMADLSNVGNTLCFAVFQQSLFFEEAVPDTEINVLVDGNGYDCAWAMLFIKPRYVSSAAKETGSKWSPSENQSKPPGC